MPASSYGYGAAAVTAVAPGTSGTLLLAANTNRIEATLTNNGNQTVYRGTNPGVTVNTGVPLPAGASFLDDRTTGPWYGVVASGTGDVRVEEVS
jgi:hypothetical protein